ncbi:putative lipid II flippase FtsW [Alteribacillus iranensis]|uniref:Probable peptidoglycan glycosyltransferase FtsW n=1 Tax=Alteribacillus iranensis TaxID=930128 RepID=A0A1I2ESC8_9BACI|nr:putative lipid II flippase FtsW [Alteribacillus iranensis]SFE95358.1 cell division-specific peptidoglycan biosynthesis regulator FtsW [Alteribacillus iranensis]
MLKRMYRDYDWWLISAAVLLSIFGVIMIYSASFPLAIDLYGDPSHFFVRQLIWLAVGLCLLMFFMHFRYRFLKKLSPFLIIGSMLLLLLVIFIGREVNGATSWFAIGPFSVQPAEFVKLAVIVYLAQVYSKKQQYINKFISGVIPPLVVVVFIFSLIMLQPDLGTAASILMTAGIIVFLSGARWRHLAVLVTLSAGVIAYFAISEPYRIQRLTAFRDPFEMAETMSGSGYQLIQAYIAIAHGGLTGTGLGQSVQKMHFLPEPHTDFILAVVAEELGILGILFVLVCLLTIAWRGILIGVRNKTTFGTLLSFGIVFQIVSQALVNAWAATGLMPITGLPFPFLSYGGSSLLVSFSAIGILASISKENSKEKRKSEDSQAA